MELSQVELIELAARNNWDFSLSGLRLPSAAADWVLARYWGNLTLWARLLGRPFNLYIETEGATRTFSIAPDWENNSNNNEDKAMATTNFAADPEINPTAYYSHLLFSNTEEACWLIRQRDQKVLLANPVAIAANHKPADQILTQDISILWQEENLQALMRDLSDIRENATLSDHTNIGYRWQQEGGIWRRVRHEFNVDYTPCNWMGEICRFERVKNAVALE